MFEQFLWVIFPYIVLTIFIFGHVYRYNHDQFGWTSKSSELLEKKLLRLGSNLFHFGIIFVFFGHVAGLLIPVGVYETFGVSENVYHIVALIGGIPAGIASVVGLIILSYRRMTVRRIIATSTKSDYLAVLLLTVVALSGLTATFLNIEPRGFDYRKTIGPWLRSVLLFHADSSYMENVPVWFKIHMTAAMGIFAVWPFTRLVHVFSLPLRYLTRSYVIYRKREPKHNSAIH